VFVPTNQAFTELPFDLMQQDSVVFSNGASRLDDVVLFHTCDTAVLDLPCAPGQNLIPSAMGNDSRTLCDKPCPSRSERKGKQCRFSPRNYSF
jgi:hypothetical protein